MAYDIGFELSREILQRAGFVGRTEGEQPEPIQEGPLIDGIPTLNSGGRCVLTWGTFGALRETLGDRPVGVSVTYQSRRRLPWDPTEHTSNSGLEIRSFLATDASAPPELRAVKAIEKLSSQRNCPVSGRAWGTWQV